MRKGSKALPSTRLGRGASVEERFFAKVRKSATCWTWTGSLWNGYGNIWYRGKVWQAHRLSLVLAGREIPAGKVVDHRCRNTTCVRPSHLRIVTPRENAVENNTSPLALNAQATHCLRGHQFTPENTYVYMVKNRKTRHGKPGRPSTT